MRRVAVLMGGESQERDISRVTGTEVARALAGRGHDVTLVDTKHGAVPLPDRGAPEIGREPPASAEAAPAVTGASSVSLLSGSLAGVDCVFIAMHGGWGEDGTVQAFFEMAGIAYTGSGVLGSALAMDKDRSKHVFRSSNVPTPDWIAFDAAAGEPSAGQLAGVHEALGDRVVVKPNAEGSTVGLSIVTPSDDLAAAIRFAARFGSRVLLETFVEGRELTVGVLGNEPLPVVEIIPEGGVYTYEAKYTKGKSRYEVPADIPAGTAAALQEDALRAFRALGCEGFGRVDYRLRPDGTFSCLEVNTIPGMTPLSLVPMAAKAAGIEFDELVDRIVEMGIRRGAGRAQGSEEVAP